MGGSGSSHGNRKVSFEMDEQERVRVLQGIRLSEDVVKRMKEPCQPKRDQRSSSFPPPLLKAAEGKSKVSTEIRPPTADNLGRKPSEAEEDLYRRYEQEQAMVQEELLRLARREREAANESLNVTLQRERSYTNEEKLKAAQLSQELQWKDKELKQRDTFYKEQLDHIEKKNSEIYKLTLDQYNQTVTNAEDQIRRRNTQPICANLQAAIHTCYSENKHQVLNCSELVKEYQRCVQLAQKNWKHSMPLVFACKIAIQWTQGGIASVLVPVMTC
ncbi:MICOS complex subunit MIC25 isoform X2 [Rhineura floridana]|uniref:MICOS complex subunit MIC25 isoform X2 n=1 Tax=Rhineura floridana TaxID=261503 RepID=UPI002AC889BD|nr:MICOS complex subunit MIC25 isoform X2 [Rhineura floridana]